jgi:hypothetical protein
MSTTHQRPFWLALVQPTRPPSHAWASWAASFLLAISASLLMGRSSEASCGDWLAPSSKSVPGPFDPLRLPASPDGSASPEASSDRTSSLVQRWQRLVSLDRRARSGPDVPAGPKPCSGPNCGRAPVLPPQPVSTSLSSTAKNFALGTGHEACRYSAQPQPTSLVVPARPLSGHPVRIERPPAR